jgi:DNA-binding transcriptional LysR family regulator
VLQHCRKLLEARRELVDACLQLKTGWEPSLKVVYDEVIDFNIIGDALMGLNELKPPTEVKVLSAHLREVESLFVAEHADLMVTVSPIMDHKIPTARMRPIYMKLVAQSGHRLNQVRQGKLKLEDLNRHTHVTIKAPDSALGLSTESFRFDSYLFVGDFTTKWSAIRKGIGFGWLPDYLIANDLEKGVLKVLKTEIANSVKLQPVLLHRPQESLGRAAKELLKFLR